MLIKCPWGFIENRFKGLCWSQRKARFLLSLMMLPFSEMRPLRQSLEWTHFKGDGLTHHQSKWLEPSIQGREVSDSQPPGSRPPSLQTPGPIPFEDTYWQTLLSRSADNDNRQIFQLLWMTVQSPLSPRTTNLLLGEMILSGFHDKLTCWESLSPPPHT